MVVPRRSRVRRPERHDALVVGGSQEGGRCGEAAELELRRKRRQRPLPPIHYPLRALTYQELDAAANEKFSAVSSRISRAEGMEGHARACDWRLRKYFPDKDWDFEVNEQQRYD